MDERSGCVVNIPQESPLSRLVVLCYSVLPLRRIVVGVRAWTRLGTVPPRDDNDTRLVMSPHHVLRTHLDNMQMESL